MPHLSTNNVQEHSTSPVSGRKVLFLFKTSPFCEGYQKDWSQLLFHKVSIFSLPYCPRKSFLRKFLWRIHLGFDSSPTRCAASNLFQLYRFENQKWTRFFGVGDEGVCFQCSEPSWIRLRVWSMCAMNTYYRHCFFATDSDALKPRIVSCLNVCFQIGFRRSGTESEMVTSQNTRLCTNRRLPLDRLICTAGWMN